MFRDFRSSSRSVKLDNFPTTSLDGRWSTQISQSENNQSLMVDDCLRLVEGGHIRHLIGLFHEIFKWIILYLMGAPHLYTIDTRLIARNLIYKAANRRHLWSLFGSPLTSWNRLIATTKSKVNGTNERRQIPEASLGCEERKKGVRWWGVSCNHHHVNKSRFAD